MECGHSCEIEAHEEENWKLLLSKYEHLIGRKYRWSQNDETYIFQGLMHGVDDYYYNMTTANDGIMMSLSCVANLEDYGMELINE